MKVQKRNPALRRVILAAVILGILLGIWCYLGSYYPADQSAIKAFCTDDTVTVTQLDSGDLVFAPEKATAGFVFYPGGKVDHSAYAPLLYACAQRGILCVAVEMPFRLAVLDANGAEGIPETYPEITNWYIGGHSLGGSMAASYLEENRQGYRGLILLGSYAITDLSASNLEVLSLYGTEDGVLNMEKYRENLVNLPADFTELVIEGGCHAYFGMYGPQDGDGTPTITNEEQIGLTADAIAAFIVGDA